MILSFHPCFTADKQIIMADRDLGPDDLDLIRRASVIILPQTCKPDLYYACKDSSARLFPNYDARFMYPGKIGQESLFRKMGFPRPDTKIWRSVSEFRETVKKSVPHRVPFFLKDDINHESAGVYLIEDIRHIDGTLEYLKQKAKGSGEFLSQEYIHAKGNVLRVVIIYNDIITYWKRPENKGQKVTTVSRGAIIDNEWRKDLQEKGRTQAKKFSKLTAINLVAIDFIFSFTKDDPQPLFLEINYYFGRRGLGGATIYYRMLFKAIKEWLSDEGFNPASIELV
jgi:ribosomal protein S6--L-glutamate ligase